MPANEDKLRITVNLEKIDARIVETLEGVLENTKAGVIYHMVREWINQNADTIKNQWGIDLIEIRKQVIAEEKGISVDGKLKELGLIDKIVLFFQTADNASVSDLIDFVEVDKKTLQSAIFGNREKLLEQGLELRYSEGRYYKVE